MYIQPMKLKLLTHHTLNIQIILAHDIIPYTETASTAAMATLT